jgi:putative pyruvate formate lyase activating enzyme
MLRFYDGIKTMRMWRFIRPDAWAVLNDEMVKRSLPRYLSVMKNEKPAKFMIAKTIPAHFNSNEQLDELWIEHEQCTEEFYKLEKKVDIDPSVRSSLLPEKSYLDLKIEISRRILKNCHFCVRRCKVDRTASRRGYCGCGDKIVVSSIFEHVGEEPELVPSGTVFTMGCTMRCIHCQNWTISQWFESGSIFAFEALAEEIEKLRVMGCRNVNLVGGEPTPWLSHLLQTFKHVHVNIPVVWNSNSYYSPETAALLAGFTDVYLLDFKYGHGRCAEKLSDARGYWEACTFNHLQAKKHGEVIVRVLVLPAHLECCVKPILRWIADNLGGETRVNLMFQYRPEWRAHEVSELRRRLNEEEKQEALRLSAEAGLKNVIT